MQMVRIPKEILGAEIQAGRVSLFRIAGTAAAGRLGGVVDLVADAGLKKAGEASDGGAVLQWPDCCCKCVSKGKQVRAVESASVVNKGVAYVFRFLVPHCSLCADTANAKRAGVMGLLAAFLSVSVPVAIVMLGFGAATNRDWLIVGSFVVGPLAGIAVPYLWMKARGSRAGRGSRYQAVYVSDLEMTSTAVPVAFTLAFENPAYASRFVALNKAAGVTAV
jgi:hypothetical protein